MSNMMTERIFMGWSVLRMQSRLNHYLDTILHRYGPQSLKLKVAFDEVTLPGGLTLSEDVDVDFRLAQDRERPRTPITISWHPVGGGPFPTFSGELAIVPDRQRSFSWIVVSGTYDLAAHEGLPFDVATGQRIAHTTAIALLYEVRHLIAFAEREMLVI